jgi:hypothetical protein
MPADLDVALPKLAPIILKAMNDQRYPEFVVSNLYIQKNERRQHIVAYLCEKETILILTFTPDSFFRLLFVLVLIFWQVVFLIVRTNLRS